MKTAIKLSFLLLLGWVLGTSAASARQITEKDSGPEYYIRLALENNPALKAQKLAYEADKQLIPQAGALPDTELSLEVYPEPMEIIGGRSVANIGVMQSLPWFGARKAAREEVSRAAQVREYQIQDEINTLILEVYSRYSELQKLLAQEESTQKHLELLEQLEKLALGKYTAGGDEGGMTEVLQIRIEKLDLEQSLQSQRTEIRTKEAGFNLLLNRDAESEISIEHDLQLRETPSHLENFDDSAAQNPEIAALEAENQVYRAKMEKDRLLSYPSFGVGIQYMVIGKTDNPLWGMGSMNGKDMLTPMVSVSLPIFRKKYEAQQLETKFRYEAVEENRNAAVNSLSDEYYRLFGEVENLNRSIELYDNQTELARTTYELLLGEYTAGKRDLMSLLQLERRLLEYRLNRAEAVADHNTKVAAIEKILAVNVNQN